MTAQINTNLPVGESFQSHLRGRNRRGKAWGGFYRLSLLVAILALIALFLNIIDSAFGYVASEYEVQPTELTPDGNLSALTEPQLVALLVQYEGQRIPVYIRDNLSVVAQDVFTTSPISAILAGKVYPPEVADLTIREVSPEGQAALLSDNMSQDQLLALVESEIVGEEIQQTWSLSQSLFQRAAIDETVAEEYPNARVYFRSWLTADFLTAYGSSDPVIAGVRAALLGTLYVIAITILFAFPVGVGAAIYLEEYAGKSRINSIIETNIRNLAGVPSIIYGLLGLAILVRSLEVITQGRTILSAGLTLGLLILPVIIINSQEALRAVPSTIREASYGLGATKWQTIWNQVLPAAMPGILTGTILALSRAVGETAPLIVIGASTFIATDPTGPFAKFTALPIQIYQWTSRPQPEFRSIAAAAIILLLILLITLNATAIILRQRFRKNLLG